MTQPLLEVEDVTCVLGGVTALADVDLEVLRALIAESAQHGADPAG